WYYNSNPNRWTKLEASSPSTAHMSPYVDWISIRNDLAEASSDEMAASTRENLIREYDRLAAQSSPTFVELVAYMERLAEHEALARDDQAFKQVAQGFYASSETSLTRTYRPRRAVFPTLAHEVGHQF